VVKYLDFGGLKDEYQEIFMAKNGAQHSYTTYLPQVFDHTVLGDEALRLGAVILARGF
jgi:hypothetical protein